jgi:hypothetical protein
MVKATRARTAETPKQPSLLLTLRAPYFYPDHTRHLPMFRRTVLPAPPGRNGCIFATYDHACQQNEVDQKISGHHGALGH